MDVIITYDEQEVGLHRLDVDSPLVVKPVRPPETAKVADAVRAREAQRSEAVTGGELAFGSVDHVDPR
jgi:hypothetical protein